MLESIVWVLVVLLVVAGMAIVAIVQPFVSSPPVSPPPAVSAEDLERHVRVLSERFHPRSIDHPENLEAAARYIEECFTATGARVESQVYEADGSVYRNIVATYGPEDGPVVVVGAHYDSCGIVPGETTTHTPGADDNASGVAGLLVLAELLRGQPLTRQVKLVAYPLEEPPNYGTDSMGSAVHAARLKGEGVDVVAMICLEMIGYFVDGPSSQGFPAPGLGLIYPTVGNFISIVGRLQDIPLTRKVKGIMAATSELPVCSMNAPAWVPGVDFSDHRNYWRHGFPAVMLTDSAFYRHGGYHQDDDTADRLDYRRMGQVVQGVYMAVVGLTRWKR